MLHALLPHAHDPARAARTPTRFVEQGVPLLLDAVLGHGARRLRLQASLCGGARIIQGAAFDGQLNIGRHNVRTATAVLETLRIPIQARDTGGTHGRTIRLYLATGKVVVGTMRGEKALPQATRDTLDTS